MFLCQARVGPRVWLNLIPLQVINRLRIDLARPQTVIIIEAVFVITLKFS